MSWGGVVLAVFNVKNITYNYSQIQDIHYLTKNVTIPHRVKYEEKGLLDLFNFLKNKKEIIYIYPTLIPHFFILNGNKTINALSSNDHLSVVLKNDFLRSKLIDSIKESKQKYLIKIKTSGLDIYLNEVLINYIEYKEFNKIIVYKIKE